MTPRAGARLPLLTPQGARIGRDGLRLALFLAVEGLAEICRRRLCATLALPQPWSPGLLFAIAGLVWSFEAHDRWTFRDARAARLDGLAPFLAIGLAGLICLDLAARASAETVLVIWPAVLALKFLGLRLFVWRPATGDQAAAP